MPVYHPHIIPSLALQAYNARNTVQSRIKIRRLIDPKEVGPSASSGTRMKVGEGGQGAGAHNFLLHINLKVGEGGQGAGAYKFLLHINTSLKRKRRFFKCPFTIHTLFLRLRFRLITQERLWVRASPHLLSLKRARQRKIEGSAADFFCFETQLLQFDNDAFSLIALDFDFTIFDCSPGATL